jgi:peptide/nickel transport system substrate-binding protein
MNKKWLLMVTLAALILMIALPASAQGGKSVTILYPQELDSMNPMYSSMYFMEITQDLYLAPAWSFDKDLNPYPVLVTEIPGVANGGISDDGTVITLTLRDDIVWSDGTPITSADFVFTYEMYASPDNITNSPYPYSPDDGVIVSVEALDALTVVVTFAEPFAPWLTTIFDEILPEHVLRPVFEDEGTLDNAAWNRNPTVGSGPFIFDEWESGSFIRFVPNDNYYNAPANLDTVVIQFVTDDVAYVDTLIAGGGDFGTFIAYSDLPQLEGAGLTPEFVNSGYNEQWLFNLREGLGHPALQDIQVREALTLGFNRSVITEDLFDGRTYPASGYWEGSPYDNPDVDAPPYDPDRANQLLDEAGWVDSNGDGTRDKDGVELVLRYITNDRQVRQDVQAIVQQQYMDIGVGIEIINYPSDIFFNSYSAGGPVSLGDYDIAEYSTTGFFPDPNTTDFLCSEITSEDNPDGTNDRGYCNSELDTLFAEQNRTTDLDQRIALFHQIDEMIANDWVFVGVWYDPDLWVVNSRVVNSAVNGVTPFWNSNEWDVTG